MTLWQRLYVTAAKSAARPSGSTEPPPSLDRLHQQILQQLPAGLEVESFRTYDPFGLLPSTRVYAQTVKLFVAPPEPATRWLKIIAAPDSVLPDALLQVLSQANRLCLAVLLEDAVTTRFIIYRDGVAAASWQDALEPYFTNADKDASGRSSLPAAPPRTPMLPTDGMPDDLRTMADQLGGSQIEKLMNRMTDKLLNADQRQDAQDLLRSTQIDWTQPGGQQIARVMSSLGIEPWQSPDYTPLRDAYQLQSRLQRNSNARRYPGDQDAIDAVPDALRYTPVFAGAGT